MLIAIISGALTGVIACSAIGGAIQAVHKEPEAIPPLIILEEGDTPEAYESREGTIYTFADPALLGRDLSKGGTPQ